MLKKNYEKMSAIFMLRSETFQTTLVQSQKNRFVRWKQNCENSTHNFLPVPHTRKTNTNTNFMFLKLKQSGLCAWKSAKDISKSVIVITFILLMEGIWRFCQRGVEKTLSLVIMLFCKSS